MHYFLMLDLSTFSRMRLATSYTAYTTRGKILEELEAGMNGCLHTRENIVRISADDEVTKKMIMDILREAHIPCNPDKIIYDERNNVFIVHLYS